MVWRVVVVRQRGRVPAQVGRRRGVAGGGPRAPATRGRALLATERYRAVAVVAEV